MNNNRTHPEGRRKPLGVVDKTEVKDYWNEADPKLPPAALKVLLYLLKCQNTKNGACFPSVGTIAAAIKMSTRSVQLGLNKLVYRGAIERIKRSGNSNVYVIWSVSELEERQMEVWKTEVKSVSRGDEISCQKGVKETSPKSGGEDREENAKAPLEPHSDNRNLTHEKFEKALTKLVEDHGFSYTDIFNLPTGTIEELYEEFRVGAKSFPQAATRLLDFLNAVQDQAVDAVDKLYASREALI